MQKSLSEDYIISTMDEIEVFIEEAIAVGLKAIKQKVTKKYLLKRNSKHL